MTYLNLYKKIIKYRKIILFNKTKLKKSSTYLLICHFNNLNGLAFKLIKQFFFSLNQKLNFKPYKNTLSRFLFNNSYKKFNKNFIFFKFFNLNDILIFIDNIRNLTLIPFIIYPLFILNYKKNILISLKNLNINYFNINKSVNTLIYIKIINILKKLIIKFFIQLNLKIKKQQQQCLL
jgi:hypothetical protein